jgi:hypothetical protein
MQFEQLIRWRDYQYVASMDALNVFDVDGNRVAGWYFHERNGFCAIHCLVNTLHGQDSTDINEIVDNWQDIVWERKMSNYYPVRRVLA